MFWTCQNPGRAARPNAGIRRNVTFCTPAHKRIAMIQCDKTRCGRPCRFVAATRPTMTAHVSAAAQMSKAQTMSHKSIFQSPAKLILPSIALLLTAPALPASSVAEPVEATRIVAQSKQHGPFTGLSGYWSGAGTITLTNGSSERLRCKATYAVNVTGQALNQSLRCASDSYRLDIHSNVVSDGGSVSGTWGEATRNVTGSISGQATNAEIKANVAGGGFSAVLNVRTNGDRQSVTIKPQGGTDVAGVSITLRKG